MDALPPRFHTIPPIGTRPRKDESWAPYPFVEHAASPPASPFAWRCYWCSAAAPENLNIFDTVSPPADSIRNLFYLIIGITGVIFVLVEGVLVYCILALSPSAGNQHGGAGATVRQQAGRGGLDGGAAADRVRAVPGSLAHHRRGAPASRRREAFASSWSAISGGGSIAISSRTAIPNWATVSSSPTSCTCRATPMYFDLESADVIHSYWFPWPEDGRDSRQDEPHLVHVA